ncbi:uncharacterized protein LOC143284910 [Babylonia areolata]|uniref:uncharacterized protein LOC143284910 n=1 Tax=Babylonia areolata TaxID=304850 RepID=UPI003FD62A1D
MADIKSCSQLSITLAILWIGVAGTHGHGHGQTGITADHTELRQQGERERMVREREVVALVGKLVEVQLSALWASSLGTERPCGDNDDTAFVLQNLPPWLLHDTGEGTLTGVPTPRHAALSTTLTLLCQDGLPVPLVTVSVTSPSNDSPGLPGSVSGFVSPSSPSVPPPSDERLQRTQRVAGGGEGAAVVLDKSGGETSSAAGMVTSDSGLFEEKLNAFRDRDSRQCSDDYLASLVLCTNPDKLNASQRVRVVRRFADFLSITRSSLTWHTSPGGQLHAADRGYTVQSGGASGDGGDCPETVHSELLWPLSCSVGRHVAEFTRILQHNVQVGRVQREVGVEVAGWYVAAKVRRLSHRRRRRQVLNTTPVPTPTPTLYPPSATAASSLRAGDSIDLTSSPSVMFSAMSASFTSSSGVSVQPSATSLFSVADSSSIQPSPSVTQHQHSATEREVPGFAAPSSSLASVAWTSSVRDVHSVTPASMQHLQTSVSETGVDTSISLSMSATPTPVLWSAALDDLVSVSINSIVLRSRSESGMDTPVSEDWFSSSGDSPVSTSQLQRGNLVSIESSSPDIVETMSQLHDMKTPSFILSSSSLTQLSSPELSSALDRLNSTKEMGVSELSASLRFPSVFTTTPLTSSLHTVSRTVSESETPLSSLSSVPGSSQVWPVMPAAVDDQLAPDTVIYSSVPLMAWSRVPVSEQSVEAMNTTQVTVVESDTVASTANDVQTSSEFSYSVLSEEMSPSISIPTRSIHVTDDLAESAIHSSQFSSQTIPQQSVLDHNETSTKSSLSSLSMAAMASSSVTTDALRFTSSAVYTSSDSSVTVTSVHHPSPTSHEGRPFDVSASQEHFPRSSVPVADSSQPPEVSLSLGTVVSSTAASESVFSASQTFFPETSVTGSTAERDSREVLPSVAPLKTTSEILPSSLLTSTSDIPSTVPLASTTLGHSEHVQPSVKRDLTSSVSETVSTSWLAPSSVESASFYMSDIVSSSHSSLHAGEAGDSLHAASSAWDSGQVMTGTPLWPESPSFVTSQATPSTPSLAQPSPAATQTSGVTVSDISIDTWIPVASPEADVPSTEWATADTVAFTHPSAASHKPSSSHRDSPQTVSVTASSLAVSDTFSGTVGSLVSSSFRSETIPSVAVVTPSLSETVSITFGPSVVSMAATPSASEALRSPTDATSTVVSFPETEPSSVHFLTSSEIMTSIVNFTSHTAAASAATTAGSTSVPATPSVVVWTPSASVISLPSTSTAMSSSLTTVTSSPLTTATSSPSASTMTPSYLTTVTSSPSISIMTSSSLTTVTPSPSISTMASSSLTTVTSSAPTSTMTSSSLTTATSQTSTSTMTSSPSTVTSSPSTSTVSATTSPGTASSTTVETAEPTTNATTTSPTPSDGWTGSSELTDGQTSTPESSTPSGVNTPPRVAHPRHYMSTTLGRYFRWPVPEDMFSDPEDGGTRSLTLTLTLPRDDKPLPASFWVQFDPATQVMYGLPLAADLDTGHHSVVIAARDSGGLTARNIINLYVNSSAFVRFTHRFVMTFTVEFSQLMQRRENVMTLVKKIGSYYGDRSPDFVTVVDVSIGSFILSWTNSSLGGALCPNTTLHGLLQRMVRADGTIRGAFNRHVGRALRLHSVALEPLGACLHPPSTTTHPHTDVSGAAGLGSDVMTDIVLPVLVSLLVLLLIVVVVVLLVHRCRKLRGGGSLETLDKGLCVADRSPVILPADLPDADGYHARPKKPFILPGDEVPQLISSSSYPPRPRPKSNEHYYRKVGSGSRRRPGSYGFDGEHRRARPITVIFNNFDSAAAASRRTHQHPAYWTQPRCQEGPSPKVRVSPLYTSTTSV